MDLKVFHRVDNRRQMTQNWPARKSPRAPLRRNGSRSRSRHSLVTPIDWKPRLPHPGGARKPLRSPFFGDAYLLETMLVAMLCIKPGIKSSFFGDTYWLEIRSGAPQDYKGSLLML